MSRRRVLSLLLASVLAACSTTTVKTPTPNTTGADVNRPDNPGDSRKRAAIRLQLASGYFQDGKYVVALDELKQALQLDPTFAEAYMLTAMVYVELGENPLAEQNFQKALQIDPGNSDVNNNYGWYLCQHNRPKDSLAYFEAALKNPLYTQKAKPLQNAGVCANRIGDATLAENYFRRSFELDPSGAVSAYNLALIFYQRQDYARARFYIGQINSGGVPSAASLWLAIRIERHLGNRNNALALENRLTREFADSREAQMQRRGNYAD